MTNLFDPTNPETIDAEMIYQAYPRKVAKAAALKAIKRAMKKNDPKILLEKVRKFAKSPAGQKGDFTPHPATWFNDGRYNDNEAEWGNVTPRIAARKAEPVRIKEFDALWPAILDWSYTEFKAIIKCLKASGCSDEELGRKVRQMNFHCRKTRTPEFYAKLAELSGSDQSATFDKEFIGEVPY